ncbi:MAG: tRNA (adenosine(37)-N6)-dimethylallyltransferase MiaA [Clostridia bacterium]|nr:tRNA (adenosine(37)-N6)-dimethylallyltransferase MiaA [Clostridia bacterium]
MGAQKIPVIVVAGATASGKTALAVRLAKRYDGEVISADSMQLYKGMDIATAKPAEEEKDGVPHHLMDFLPVTDVYSVARYVEDANRIVDAIVARGHVPIVTGGTGLYIDSLIDNIVFEEEPDNAAVRAELKARRETEGIEALYAELERADPVTAAALDIRNENRVLRALEVFYLTGETLSERQRRSRLHRSRFEPVFIGLDYEDRSLLYERIDRRVDGMMARGLLKEAAEYYRLPQAATASQAIGYKELKGYFNGELSLDEAVENLKRATRRYAKRQLTWFRKNERIHWIFRDNMTEDEVFNEAAAVIDAAGSFPPERK